MPNFSAVLCLLLVSLASTPVAKGEWGRFRGPNGSGVGTGSGYPVQFSPSSDVVWKVATPYGQSSPVVSGNRVFVTGSNGDMLLTICIDTNNGQELWRREVRRT